MISWCLAELGPAIGFTWLVKVVVSFCVNSSAVPWDMEPREAAKVCSTVVS
jgi:hypothetical protein